MIIGGKIQYRGKTATLLFAGTSSIALNEFVESLGTIVQHYTEITEPTGRDRLFDDIYSGMKSPMYVIVHDSEIQRNDFITLHDITIHERTEWEYYQQRQSFQDEMDAETGIQEMANLDAISGIENNSSVAKRLGIDIEDEWDKRTEKEKAEDAAASSAHYNRLVSEGIITDEAIAPSHEQSGNRDQAILDMVENIKNGMNYIDPENIPPVIQKQIDDMVSSGEIDIDDVEDYIKDINERVKEDCKSGDIEKISRIFGDVRVDETGVQGASFFVNMKNGGSLPRKNKVPLPEDKLTEQLMKKKSDDEIAEIMKPSSIDGIVRKNVVDYVINNTSLDMYDLKDELEKITGNETENVFNEDSLPENIGKNSIDYGSTTKEYAVISKLIDEDSGLYAFSVAKIGDVTDNDIIGTNNVGYFFVHDGHICYTRKDKTYGTSYFTIEYGGVKYVYNVNI